MFFGKPEEKNYRSLRNGLDDRRHGSWRNQGEVGASFCVFVMNLLSIRHCPLLRAEWAGWGGNKEL